MALGSVKSEKPNIASYDWVVINSSSGKDSQCMLDVVVNEAIVSGVPLDRLVVVHCNLKRAEWPGALELARDHAAYYGLRFEVVTRPQGDLLQQIEQRGKWPSSSCRYCTSDHKRGQVAKLFTRLQKESGRHVRILNCMGMRAEESPARSKMVAFENDKRHTSSRRLVDKWLPIHAWKLDQVWERNNSIGTKHHFAYDLGMPRLSCVFCIFSPRAALTLGGRHNRELLDEYVAIEERIEHDFRVKLRIAEIKEAIESGEEQEAVDDWTM